VPPWVARELLNVLVLWEVGLGWPRPPAARRPSMV